MRKPESITLSIIPDLDPAALDVLVASFQENKKRLKPYLRIGNTDTFPQESGAPAAGWITSAKREGNKLVFNVSHVLPAIVDIVAVGNYELRLEVYKTGNSQVIKSIAIYSSQIPKVAGVDDILLKCYSQEAPVEDDFLETHVNEIEQEAKASGVNFKTAMATVYNRYQSGQRGPDYTTAECFEGNYEKISGAYPELGPRYAYEAARMLAAAGRGDSALRQVRYEGNGPQFIEDLKKTLRR